MPFFSKDEIICATHRIYTNLGIELPIPAIDPKIDSTDIRTTPGGFRFIMDRIETIGIIVKYHRHGGQRGKRKAPELLATLMGLCR